MFFGMAFDFLGALECVFAGLACIVYLFALHSKDLHHKNSFGIIPLVGLAHSAKQKIFMRSSQV